jgi:tRNA A-37 threonylcarbamoyl transferase component Bud32
VHKLAAEVLVTMAFVTINDKFGPLFAALGLRDAEDFLQVPSVVISGHPDRNVARITLDSISALIKREHCVRWRDRFASWFAGYGFSSKSTREARTLAALQEAGIGCPEWMAFGEDDRGRAFLIVKALTGSTELRERLRKMRSPDERRRLASHVGAALALMHAAGFDHPDLYSKHVFVNADGRDCHFLDWQRSRRGSVSHNRRVRDLATLNATLAEEFVSARERLACLFAYALAARGLASAKDSTKAQLESRKLRPLLFWAVYRETNRLLGKRRIRNARIATNKSQELIWLCGEALCITPQFLQELSGDVPDWLRLEQTAWNRTDAISSLHELPGDRRGVLVRRRRSQFLQWLWTEFRRKPLMTPEATLAGMLFRRQRQGESAPRLLAFGQRRTLPWRTESFLLTEAPMPVGEEKR